MAQKICPQCGAENPENARYCSNCGYPLDNVVVNNNTTDNNNLHKQEQNQNKINTTINEKTSMEDIKTHFNQNQQDYLNNLLKNNTELAKEIDLWSAYVQSKIDYYIPKFIEFKTLGKKVSWNWAAFFFAPYWLAYRKMLGLGIFMGLLQLLPLIGILVYILIGMYGNHIYYKDTTDAVKKALLESNYLNADPKTILYAKGGTSVGNIFIVFIILFVIVSLFYALGFIINESRY